MLEIKLKELKLKNFKGIKDLTINFNEKTTNIFGDNGVGKTTIFDSYLWLLFDKDSNNSSNFNIKTLDENGNAIEKIEHTVTGVFEIDGKILTLSKTLKEKWTKKRGSTEENFSGHETEYFINDVPVKQKDYKDRISTLIKEEQFKLISNPRYFSADLDKKARRAILLSIADEISDQDIIQENENISELPLDDYNIQEILATNKAILKKANKELEEYPIRIDELKENIKDIDFDALEFRRRSIVPALRELEAGSNTDNLKEISGKITDLTKKKYEIENRNLELDRKRKQQEQKEKEVREEVKRLNEKNLNLEEELGNLRKEYVEIANKKTEFDTHCPTCGQELPGEQIEKIQEKYNLNKSKELEKIIESSNKIKADIEKNKKNIELLENTTFETIEVKAESTESIEKEIEELRKQLHSTDNTENTEKIKKLEQDLKEIDEKLLFKQVNENAKNKIEEYTKKMKKLSKIYTESEKIVYLAEEYNKIKAEIISKSINEKFKLVGFKLFEKQINGGIAEVCEATVNGVPYADVNNAAKINAGIDIINTLTEVYKIKAPIFVDNAESVNELIDTESQIIRLVVSKDKELVIR